MDNLFRAVFAVPKAGIDRREKQWQKQQKKAPPKRTPPGPVAQ
jgi:hypothetical protein